MLEKFAEKATNFENLIKSLPSTLSRIFALFSLWITITFILFLIGAIGGLVSGWLVAFSILANVVWIIIVIAMIVWVVEEMPNN